MTTETDAILRGRIDVVITALQAEERSLPRHAGAARAGGLRTAVNMLRFALGDGACACKPLNGVGFLADPASDLYCLHGTPDPVYQEQTGEPHRPVPNWVAALALPPGQPS